MPIGKVSGIRPPWETSPLYAAAAVTGGGYISVHPSGTITFLFTDIEGSTLLWEAHREAMRGALALHDEILRGAIEAAGGYVFATGGDAFSVAFASAEAAIDAALSGQLGLQSADWGATGRLKVRMAIHTGSAEERDGNYFGPPLNRCARILSAADGDDVLVSLTTQQLLRGRLPPDSELVDIGEIRLKDLGLSDRMFRLIHPDLIESAEATSGEVGRQLRGYELIERIGEGGFGVVYRAKQAGVGREVAIKVVRAEFANDPEFIRRFDAEAQLVARLEHPYVVPLYDYWREPDGAYLVMRWLRGGNLKTALRTGPWKLDAIVRLLGQIGGALALAHRRGVIHRDIKPANILLDEEGNAYLSDFGIAHDISLAAQLKALDASTSWPAYSSPEQLRREATSPLADIYSLGMVLHELVTGAYPFGDATPSELRERQLTEPLPRASSVRSDVPEALDRVIAKATAADPADRYQDVAALVADVEALSETTAARAPAVTVEARNPYKGLRAFQQNDTGDFFGREALTGQIIEKLRERRLVAVVGASGSGKSSVVKAGVLPTLRSGTVAGWDSWFFTEMVPGTRPFDELEAALLRVAVNPPATLLEQLRTDDHGLLRAVKRILPEGDIELVLVIDQFEEVFSHVADADVRKQFLAALRAAAADEGSRLRVIITLRADFFDQPLLYPEFAEMLKAGLVTVTPLTGEELERAIVEPGRLVGVSFEPGLVGDIVANVSDQPGALPLLQYALSELYERKEDALLTVAAYRAIGGVAGALGMRAAELYDQLDEPAQVAARQVFIRLVTLGEGTSDTRRRVLRDELTTVAEDPAAVTEVLDAFGGSRLLSFDRDPQSRSSTVEVAHEALLTEWHRLREWIDSSRDDLRLHRRLAVAAGEWAEADGDSSFLLGGARLDQIETWMQTSSIALARQERDYVEASVTQRIAQIEAEREQQAREAALEKRAVTRLRSLVGVLAVAAVIAAGLTLFAFSQRSEADKQREVALAESERAQAESVRAQAESERAQMQTRIATARGLAAAAIANLDIDPERSILLALQGVDETRALGEPVLPEVVDALHRALQATRIEALVQPATTGAFSANGGLLVSGGLDGTIRVWDTDSPPPLQEVARTRSPHAVDLQSVDMSPDGTLLASAGGDGLVRIWDTETGLLLVTIHGHDGESVGRLKFSPNGKHLATSGGDGTLKVWNVATGEETSRFVVGGSPFGSADMDWSPDGARLVATQNVFGSSLVVFDLATGTAALEIPTGNAPVCSVAFSPDGSSLLAGTMVGSAGLWDISGDAPEPEPILTLLGHTDVVCRVGFSPQGDQVATASADGTVKLWNADDGRLLFTLAGHTGPIRDLSFHPDGPYLFTSGFDGIGRIWDVSARGSREVDTLDSAGPVTAVAYSPDGDRVAFYSVAEGVVLWTPTALEDPVILPQAGRSSQNNSVAFTADGARVAAIGSVGTVIVWDADTGGEITTLKTPAEAQAMSLSPDGSKVAVAGGDGVARIVDITSGEIRSELAGDGPGLGAIAYHPQGTVVAFGDADGTVILWDTTTGARLHTLSLMPGFGVFALTFSPDGSMLAAATEGIVWVLDVATGDLGPVLQGHSGVVWDVEFSPDGTTIASAGSGGMIKLWDPATGTVLLALAGHKSVVTGLAFSPDGTRLVTSSADETVRVYALDLDELTSLARSRLTRSLLPEECRQYLGLDECPTA